jgi:hypothetical protein
MKNEEMFTVDIEVAGAVVAVTEVIAVDASEAKLRASSKVDDLPENPTSAFLY